jgi:hypothetical protein
MTSPLFAGHRESSVDSSGDNRIDAYDYVTELVSFPSNGVQSNPLTHLFPCDQTREMWTIGHLIVCCGVNGESLLTRYPPLSDHVYR